MANESKGGRIFACNPVHYKYARQRALCAKIGVRNSASTPWSVDPFGTVITIELIYY